MQNQDLLLIVPKVLQPVRDLFFFVEQIADDNDQATAPST